MSVSELFQRAPNWSLSPEAKLRHINGVLFVALRICGPMMGFVATGRIGLWEKDNFFVMCFCADPYSSEFSHQ